MLMSSEKITPDSNPIKFGHLQRNKTLNGRAAVAGPSLFEAGWGEGGARGGSRPSSPNGRYRRGGLGGRAPRETFTPLHPISVN